MKYVHHMIYILCGSNIALEILNTTYKGKLS